jgi:hypothetical protein
MRGRAAHALSSVALASLASLGCGDRAPPALWPEPPPPTLAAPIGIDEGEGEGEMSPPVAEAEHAEVRPRSKLPPAAATPSETAPPASEPAAVAPDKPPSKKATPGTGR